MDLWVSVQNKCINEKKGIGSIIFAQGNVTILGHVLKQMKDDWVKKYFKSIRQKTNTNKIIAGYIENKEECNLKKLLLIW